MPRGLAPTAGRSCVAPGRLGSAHGRDRLP